MSQIAMFDIEALKRGTIWPYIVQDNSYFLALTRETVMEGHQGAVVAVPMEVVPAPVQAAQADTDDQLIRLWLHTTVSEIATR